METEQQSREDIAGCLRSALRTLVRPVAVITAEHDGERYAMAATAFCEVSMDPPSMLVCINRSNSTYKAIEAGADLGLNLLSEEQADISNACGGPTTPEGKFSVGNWVHEDGRPPRLADGCASMILRPVQLVDQGTHVVVIGEITDISCQQGQTPLAFHDGGYMFPLASTLLHLIPSVDEGLNLAQQSNSLIMRLMGAFYWLDEGMQSELQRRGWDRISRSESMVFSNLAMGIRRTSDIAYNLGLNMDGLREILQSMDAKGLITEEPDPDNPKGTLLNYSTRSRDLREEAMEVLSTLEDIVGERIGKQALHNLRATLSRDWGEIPDHLP